MGSRGTAELYSGFAAGLPSRRDLVRQPTAARAAAAASGNAGSAARSGVSSNSAAPASAPVPALPPVPAPPTADRAYAAAVRRLLGLTDFNAAGSAAQAERQRYRKQRMQALLERLGNPHLAVPAIHLAGTNGKGSTAAMIASILSHAGLRAGLFTSPHLHSFVERIRLGLRPISRGDFATLLAQVWPQAQALARSSHLPGAAGAVTTLELLTAMAFQYFRAAGAHYQVIEVFVGGRDDTTNVVHPALAVITNISRDHLPVLGRTLLDVARAKAGIIKRGVPVVVAPQRPLVRRCLAATAREQAAPLIEVPRRPQAALPASDPIMHPCQDLSWHGRRGHYRVALPLRGRVQRENAALAITAAECLMDHPGGGGITRAAVHAGLANVSWPARFELLQRAPVTVIADGAHCPRAMRCLVSDLKRLQPERRIVALVGAQRGHDVVPTLRLLHPLVSRMIVTRSHHPRAVPATELAAALHTGGVTAQATTLPTAAALRRLLGDMSAGDLVLATGSLSVAAEAREALQPEIEADWRLPAAGGRNAPVR